MQAVQFKKIYALLVGINNYLSPVSSLNGCVQDVYKMESFLTGYRGSEEKDMVLLLNKDATYAHIIKGFRDHLRKASEDDVVLFHFSGHGSEELTAENFLDLEPTGKDQTLVCHDSRPGGLHLADKELAALIQEVATTYPDGSPKKGSPHIVICLDCCHSGSGTRGIVADPLIRTRNAPSLQSGRRSIDTYLNGYYANQGASLSIPHTRHILLSACESVEKAGDKPSGGVFTTALVEVLDSVKGNINYADLFVRAKASTVRARKKQTPQFETIGNFNPYTQFLSGSPQGEPDRFQVKDKNGTWYISCGAIHGIPTQLDEPLQVEISTTAPNKKKIATASLERIGAQESLLTFIGDEAPLEPETIYEGTLSHLPARPVLIRLIGASNGIALLKKHWNESKNILYVEDENQTPTSNAAFDVSECPLGIDAQDGQYVVIDLRNNRTLYSSHKSSSGYKDVEAQFTLQTLDRIVKWQRTVELKNPDSRIADMYDLNIGVYEVKEGKGAKAGVYSQGEIKLYASEENTRWDTRANAHLMGFKPKLLIKDVSQPLYAYFLRLEEDFGISCEEGELVFRPEEHAGETEVWLDLYKRGMLGWGIISGAQRASITFKLLVTTEPLAYQQFLQEGIRNRGNRGGAFGDFLSENVFDAWDARTITFNMFWQRNEINSERDIDLPNTTLRIRAHKADESGAHIQAKVTLDTASADQRSLDPVHRFTELDSANFEMINFSNQRDLEAKNVLELTDIDTSSANLHENPLEIEIFEKTDEDEIILPVAFDGNNFVIVGDSFNEGDHSVVQIKDLPDVDPNGALKEEAADRSMFKALKMAFFKLKLKKDESTYFKLRWVEYMNDGSVERHSDDVQSKINNANKILLVLHGIIGDTESIAQGMYLAQDPDEVRIKDKFDLVLSFDYENLNTSIKDIARELKERLLEAGFGANDDKEVVILCHSMGGLVSRWFIEKEEGHEIIDHLVQVGTPNGGSKFGTIEEYRSFASTALNIAVNFVGDLIPFAGRTAKILNGVGNVTVTLGQMSPNSDFLKDLNDGTPPPIPYTVVGGDITDYEVPGGGFKKLFSYLKEKAVVRVGHTVYKDEENDIAVSLDSIFEVGIDDSRKLEVNCHHLNYFVAPAGLERIGALEL